MLKIKIVLKIFLPIVLLIFFSFYFLLKRNEVSFDIDEHSFLRKSYYFDLFFLKKDFKDQRWHNEDAHTQPKIGTYIYGLGLHFYGVKNIERFQEKIGFNYKPDKERSWWEEYWTKKFSEFPANLKPAVQLILFSRLIAIGYSLMTILAVFILCYKIGRNLLFAFLAALILGLNNLMTTAGVRAMTDSMQLFAFYANLLMSYYFWRASEKNNKKKIFWLGILLGINAFFGVGIKVSGIMIWLFLIVFSIVLITSRVLRKKTIKWEILSLLTALMTFFSLYVFFHPYLYQDTVKHFIIMFTDRLAGADDYRLLFPDSAIYSHGKAIILILFRTLLPWGNYLNFKIFYWLPLDLYLFMFGFILLTYKTIKYLVYKKEIRSEAILIIWNFVVFLSMIYYLRNDWPRYYLPIVSIIAIIQAYALAYLFGFLKKKIMR